MDYAAKGADWAAKADKRLKSFTLFGGNKYEEAAEMYEKAANQFKLAKACARREGRGGSPAAAKSCRRPPPPPPRPPAPTRPRLFLNANPVKEAGETFMKLADVHTKLESRHDAASAWVEAAKAFLKVDQRRKFEHRRGAPALCVARTTEILHAGQACQGQTSAVH